MQISQFAHNHEIHDFGDNSFGVLVNSLLVDLRLSVAVGVADDRGRRRLSSSSPLVKTPCIIQWLDSLCTWDLVISCITSWIDVYSRGCLAGRFYIFPWLIQFNSQFNSQSNSQSNSTSFDTVWLNPRPWILAYQHLRHLASTLCLHHRHQHLVGFSPGLRTWTLSLWIWFVKTGLIAFLHHWSG